MRPGWVRWKVASEGPVLGSSDEALPRFGDRLPAMLARVRSAALLGIEAYPVEVEVDL